MQPLDPHNLTPAASLNRMPLLAVPGTASENGAAGRLAYDLLSREALVGEIELHAASLGIDTSSVARPRLPELFERCFAAPAPDVRHVAEQLAQRWGRRLGALVLTLARGDEHSRAARTDWDASYWAHWSTIRDIRLGGGLAGGELGPRLVEAANLYLVQAGRADVRLRLAAWPALLPLIGAARSVWAGYRSALVFDLGQTAIKRAVARFDNSVLAGLRVLPPRATQWLPARFETAPSDTQLQQRANGIAALLAQTWREHAGVELPAPLLVCSMASYIAANHPLPRQGGLYSGLGVVADNLGSWLGARVSEQLGLPVDVELLHDGTAAARAVAGAPSCAVIMLGTALGVGFAPPSDGLRPMIHSIAELYK